MATVTTSIGTNTSIDSETPSSGSGSNPYTVTFGTDPTGVSVGDSVHFDNGMGTVYVYLVTGISGSNYTLKWISGGWSATNPYGIVDMSYSQAVGVFKRTYSTITLWESDLDNTSYYSSGDDAVGEVYNDSVFNERFIIDGGGTVGLGSVKLTVPSSQRHDGTENSGARIQYTGTSSPTIVLKRNDVTVEWLELDLSSTGSGVLSGINFGANAHTDVFFKHNIVRDLKDQSNDVNGIYVWGSGSGSNTRHCLNNIVYNIEDSNDSAFGIRVASPNYPVNLYNNTVYYVKTGSGSEDAYCIAVNDTDAVLKNNITARPIGGDDLCFGGSGFSGATTDYNLSTDSTATGTNSVTGEAYGDLFVSDTAGTEDLHLKTGADAIGAGVDLGTSPTGVNIDIDGRDRDAEGDTWDIGADQTAVSVVNVTPTNAGITGTAHADLHAVAPLNAGITGTAHADLHSVIPVNAGIAAAAHADLHAVQPVNAGITATAATGPLVVTPTHASIAATSHSTILAVLPSVATITATAADDFNEVIPAPATITATAVDNLREYTPAPATITASAEPPPTVVIPTAPSVTATSHNDTLAIDVVHCSVTASAHKNILAVIPPHASMSHAVVMSLETIVTPAHAGISASCAIPLTITPETANITASGTMVPSIQPEAITIISSAFIALVDSPSELLISIVHSADISSSLDSSFKVLEVSTRDYHSAVGVEACMNIPNSGDNYDAGIGTGATPWSGEEDPNNQIHKGFRYGFSSSASGQHSTRTPDRTSTYSVNLMPKIYFLRFGNFLIGNAVSKVEVKVYRSMTSKGFGSSNLTTKITLGDYDDAPLINTVSEFNSRSLRSSSVTQEYAKGDGAWIDSGYSYVEDLDESNVDNYSVKTDITTLYNDLIANKDFEEGNFISVFWEEPHRKDEYAPAQNDAVHIYLTYPFSGSDPNVRRMAEHNPNWFLALPKLLITYVHEVENVVFIDPATSTASTTIGTIIAGTTVLHPVAEISATAPDAIVTDIQQPIMSLLGVAKEYSNIVVYQNNVGEVFAVRGFGPAEPINTATDDQIISLSSHASGYSNMLVYQKGDGSVVMKKDSRLSSPSAPASSQIISSHGFNLSSGKVVVITQDGDGDVKVKSDIT